MENLQENNDLFCQYNKYYEICKVLVVIVNDLMQFEIVGFFYHFVQRIS